MPARSGFSPRSPTAIGTTGRCGPRRRRLTGGGGNSTALVGTPETVAAALLDYYDLGITLLSARGYDIYDDAIDFGRYVIPLVREEVARRDATAAATAAQAASDRRNGALAHSASR